MKLRINSLKEGTQTITMTVMKGEVGISDKCFTNPIETVLSIDKESHQITVKGHLSTSVTLECDRCLESYNRDLDAGFLAVLNIMEPNSATSDENIIPVTSKTNEVDLTSFAHDVLLTEIPMKNICSEACAGICPGCGANLNIEKCRCKTVPLDERWKPLENLLTNTSEE